MALPSPPALELRDLAKSFSATPVLHGISLVVEPNAFCILLGPSGCGKSTALRCVAGLESPDAGDILIDGASVIDRQPAQRRVSMVFQSYALYPHMTVHGNLAFPLKMERAPRATREARIHEVATLLQIETLLDRKPRQLSGGQRQRVAIGRALVRQPRVFLFDEPLSNLDARLRAEMRVELARLHRRLSATMLYVTHDQVEAMTLGTQIVVMNEGHIEQIGKPAGVYARPATRFVAQFIGTPPMNVLPGRLDGATFHGPGIHMRLPPDVIEAVPRDASAVELGVRPEHIELGPAQPGEGKLSGRVELIEDLGADRLAHVDVPAGRVVMRLRSHDTIDTAVSASKPVMLRVPADRVHLFADGMRVA